MFGEVAAQKIASDQVDHLMPIFKWVGIDSDGDGVPNRFDDNDGVLDEDDACPLNPAPNCGLGEYIAADGKIWFQPDQFIGETWDSINAVCAGGPCNGVVAGYDMNGWTWATPADVASLANHYGDFVYPSSDCAVEEDFYNVGWRKTNGIGFGPSEPVYVDLFGYTAGASLNFFIVDDCMALPGTLPIMIPTNAGAWFYQAP